MFALIFQESIAKCIHYYYHCSRFRTGFTRLLPPRHKERPPSPTAILIQREKRMSCLYKVLYMKRVSIVIPQGAAVLKSIVRIFEIFNWVNDYLAIMEGGHCLICI
jgi:hypothetical protein